MEPFDEDDTPDEDEFFNSDDDEKQKMLRLIDNILRAHGVPPGERKKLKQKMLKQLEDEGTTSIKLPNFNPKRGLVPPIMMPFNPSFMFEDPDATGSDDSPEGRIISESSRDDHTIGLTEEFLHDMNALVSAIDVCEVLSNRGTPEEKEKLIPRIYNVRRVMLDSFASRLDDFAAALTRAEFDRKKENDADILRRWKKEVADGETTLGFKTWRDKYDSMCPSSDSIPDSPDVPPLLDNSDDEDPID